MLTLNKRGSTNFTKDASDTVLQINTLHVKIYF